MLTIALRALRCLCLRDFGDRLACVQGDTALVFHPLPEMAVRQLGLDGEQFAPELDLACDRDMLTLRRDARPNLSDYASIVFRRRRQLRVGRDDGAPLIFRQFLELRDSHAESEGHRRDKAVRPADAEEALKLEIVEVAERANTVDFDLGHGTIFLGNEDFYPTICRFSTDRWSDTVALHETDIAGL